MPVIEEWDEALDGLIAARKHMKEMRGKVGEEFARQDYVRAHKAYDKATEKALKDT